MVKPPTFAHTNNTLVLHWDPPPAVHVGGVVLEPHMPGIPITFVFSHVGGQRPPFPSHVCSTASHAAVGLFLHLHFSSSPGSFGHFPQGCSDAGIYLFNQVYLSDFVKYNFIYSAELAACQL